MRRKSQPYCLSWQILTTEPKEISTFAENRNLRIIPVINWLTKITPRMEPKFQFTDKFIGEAKSINELLTNLVIW